MTLLFGTVECALMYTSVAMYAHNDGHNEGKMNTSLFAHY